MSKILLLDGRIYNVSRVRLLKVVDRSNTNLIKYTGKMISLLVLHIIIGLHKDRTILLLHSKQNFQDRYFPVPLHYYNNNIDNCTQLQR